MSGRLQLISATNPAWADWLQRTQHDIYHGAAYHHFMEKLGYGEAWLAVFGSRDQFLAWPYLLRSIAQGPGGNGTGLRDVGSVEGYAGPLGFGCSSGDPFHRRAYQALLEHWKATGVVSVFCRFHPLLGNHRWVETLQASTPDDTADREQLGSHLRLEGHTVSVDLTLTNEEAWSHYRDSCRRHINRARRLNLVSEVDCHFQRLPDFMRMYYDTMNRNRAAAQYYYTSDFVETLWRALAPAIFLHVAHVETTAAAAVLVSEYRGIVQYLFGGVEDEFYCTSPLKLLLEDVRVWARSRGNLVLHLGGGRGGHEDSLFYFKSSFSPRRHPFYTGRWILDATSYRRLSEERQQMARKGGKTLEPGFFPAYRAPFSDTSET
jgi:hypothetical protein